MTTQPELNNYEKRLLELAKSDDSIVRYRRSMLINSILYSGLFAFATYAIDWSQRATSLYYIIAGVLAVYSLLSGFAVINFHRALNTYRALLGKLTGLLGDEKDKSAGGRRGLGGTDVALVGQFKIEQCAGEGDGVAQSNKRQRQLFGFFYVLGHDNKILSWGISIV